MTRLEVSDELRLSLPLSQRSWLFARRDRCEDPGRGLLNVMERFRECLPVAVPNLDVRSGCFRSVQADGVGHNGSDGFGFGFPNCAGGFGVAITSMHELMTQFMNQDR